MEASKSMLPKCLVDLRYQFADLHRKIATDYRSCLLQTSARCCWCCFIQEEQAELTELSYISAYIPGRWVAFQVPAFRRQWFAVLRTTLSAARLQMPVAKTSASGTCAAFCFGLLKQLVMKCSAGLGSRANGALPCAAIRCFTRGMEHHPSKPRRTSRPNKVCKECLV